MILTCPPDVGDDLAFDELCDIRWESWKAWNEDVIDLQLSYFHERSDDPARDLARWLEDQESLFRSEWWSSYSADVDTEIDGPDFDWESWARKVETELDAERTMHRESRERIFEFEETICRLRSDIAAL